MLGHGLRRKFGEVEADFGLGLGFKVLTTLTVVNLQNG